MGLPACYSDAELTELIVALPRAPRPQSNPPRADATIIHLETGRGVRYDYTQAKRLTPVYEFFVPESELATFETLHNAVVTDETKIAFYFVRDSDELSPPTALHCKKEDNFHPEPAGMWNNNGTIEQWFIYRLELTEEIEAVDIDD